MTSSTLPILSTSRLLSVATVCAIVALYPDSARLEPIMIAGALAHFVLGIWYTRRRIGKAAGDTKALATLVVFGGAGFLLGNSGKIGIVLAAFAIHNAFTEVYTDSAPKLSSLRAFVGMAFQLFVFACLWRVHALNPLFHFAFAGAWILFAIYVGLLANDRASYTGRELLEQMSSPVLMAAALIASFYVHISVVHLAMYHYIFWIYFPALRMPRAASARYVTATVVVTATMLALSPLSPLPFAVSGAAWIGLFGLQTLIHVSLSLVTSDATPAIVRRWLASRPDNVESLRLQGMKT